MIFSETVHVVSSENEEYPTRLTKSPEMPSSIWSS
jgi:hypothetical protein